jgi:hypothetical protein
VRVAHLSADTSPFDVCVLSAGDEVIAGPLLKDAGRLDGLAFPGVTEYVPLPAGAHELRLVAPDSADCDVGFGGGGVPDVPFTLEPDQAYTLAATGSLSPIRDDYGFEVIAIVDDLTPPAPGTAHLRFIQAVPNLPDVDVGTMEGADVVPVWTSLAYESASAYEAVQAPFSEVLGIRPSGDSAILTIQIPGVTASQGAIVDLFAVGYNSDIPGLEPLRLLTCVVGGACEELDPAP